MIGGWHRPMNSRHQLRSYSYVRSSSTRGVSWTLGGNLRTGVLWNLIGILYHTGRSYSILDVFLSGSTGVVILFCIIFFAKKLWLRDGYKSSLLLFIYFLLKRKIRFRWFVCFFFPPRFVRKIEYLMFWVSIKMYLFRTGE